MRRRNGRFSLSLVFSSFFGAAMIASAFAYYNFKFSQYNFFDFKKTVLYGKNDIFIPHKQRYGVIIYSSKMKNFDKILEKREIGVPVIAIDIFLQKRGKEGDVTFLTAGTNTMLKLIHRFAVREVPTFFLIKKINDQGLYKQDSQLYTLN